MTETSRRRSRGARTRTATGTFTAAVVVLTVTATGALTGTVSAAPWTTPPGPPPGPPRAVATGGGGNGIEKQSARTVADRAQRALRGAGSLHARLTDRRAAHSAHRPRTVDLTLDRQGNCTGTMRLGRGSVSLVKRGDDVWLRPDEEFWKQQVPKAGGVVARVIGSRYVHGTARNGFLRRMARVCDLDTFRKHADKAASSGAGLLRKGRATDVGGTRAVPLSARGGGRSSTLYVAAQGTPYPVRAVVHGRHTDVTTVFDGFGKPVPAKTPSPSDSVDVSRLAEHLPGG